jgi:hypothetical protein
VASGIVSDYFVIWGSVNPTPLGSPSHSDALTGKKRFPQVTVLVVDDRLAPACRCPSVGTERKHKMRERNRSKLLGIAGFVALAAILAVQGFGISGSGSSNMNDRMLSPTIMSASYNHHAN